MFPAKEINLFRFLPSHYPPIILNVLPYCTEVHILHFNAHRNCSKAYKYSWKCNSPWNEWTLAVGSRAVLLPSSMKNGHGKLLLWVECWMFDIFFVQLLDNLARTNFFLPLNNNFFCWMPSSLVRLLKLFLGSYPLENLLAVSVSS